MTIEPGTTVGGCRITAKVGEGGMGAVYRAKDEHLDREVAVKFLLEGQLTDQGRKRFLREAGAIARCNHPGIVRIHSYGEHEGRPYFIMEFVEGKSVGQFLAAARAVRKAGSEAGDLERFGYLPPRSADEDQLPYFLRPVRRDPVLDPAHLPQVCALVAETADALAEAHGQGILHRDVKPSNILVSGQGRVKLVDFGLSKRREDLDITSTHQILGTLKYIPPERLKGGPGAVTPLGDLFSLGVVFYELATLEHPFEAEDTPAFIAKLNAAEFTPPSRTAARVPAPVEEIMLRCLARDPASRWQSGKELAAALRGAAEGQACSSGGGWWRGLRSLFAGPAEAEDQSPVQPLEPTREFDAAQLRKLKVVTIGGDVTLARGEAASVRVEFVSDGCGHCAPRMVVSGSCLQLEVQGGRKGRSCRGGFKVAAPASLAVEVLTGVGDISVAGMEGGLKVTTGTGDVALDAVRGDLCLKSGTGDVSGTVYSEAADFKSGTGDLSLTWSAVPAYGKVEIKTGSGDADLAFPEGTAMGVRFKSGAGSLKSAFGSDPDADFSVAMVSGAGDLELRKA